MPRAALWCAHALQRRRMPTPKGASAGERRSRDKPLPTFAGPGVGLRYRSRTWRFECRRSPTIGRMDDFRTARDASSVTHARPQPSIGNGARILCENEENICPTGQLRPMGGSSQAFRSHQNEVITKSNRASRTLMLPSMPRFIFTAETTRRLRRTETRAMMSIRSSLFAGVMALAAAAPILSAARRCGGRRRHDRDHRRHRHVRRHGRRRPGDRGDPVLSDPRGRLHRRRGFDRRREQQRHPQDPPGRHDRDGRRHRRQRRVLGRRRRRDVGRGSTSRPA